MSYMEAFGLSDDAVAGFPDSPSHVPSCLSSPGASSVISNCLGPGSVGVEDRDSWGEESGRVERAGLGARMMGTELGRTLSAKDPRCVGELLLFANEGSGGCSTTQTCCCPPLGGEEMLLVVLLLLCFEGELRSEPDLSGLSNFSANKKKKSLKKLNRVKTCLLMWKGTFIVNPNNTSNRLNISLLSYNSKFCNSW